MSQSLFPGNENITLKDTDNYFKNASIKEDAQILNRGYVAGEIPEAEVFNEIVKTINNNSNYSKNSIQQTIREISQKEPQNNSLKLDDTDKKQLFRAIEYFIDYKLRNIIDALKFIISTFSLNKISFNQTSPINTNEKDEFSKILYNQFHYNRPRFGEIRSFLHPQVANRIANGWARIEEVRNKYIRLEDGSVLKIDNDFLRTSVCGIMHHYWDDTSLGQTNKLNNNGGKLKAVDLPKVELVNTHSHGPGDHYHAMALKWKWDNFHLQIHPVNIGYIRLLSYTGHNSNYPIGEGAGITISYSTRTDTGALNGYVDFKAGDVQFTVPHHATSPINLEQTISYYGGHHARKHEDGWVFTGNKDGTLGGGTTANTDIRMNINPVSQTSYHDTLPLSYVSYEIYIGSLINISDREGSLPSLEDLKQLVYRESSEGL